MPPMRIAAFVAALSLAAFANLAFWYLPNRPVPLAEPWAGTPVQSVSFAPFRRGQSPPHQDMSGHRQQRARHQGGSAKAIQTLWRG